LITNAFFFFNFYLHVKLLQQQFPKIQGWKPDVIWNNSGKFSIGNFSALNNINTVGWASVTAFCV